MVGQGVEKLTKSTAENFEQLMRKQGLEGVIGKEGYKFIIRGRDSKEDNFKVLAEFETKEEAEDWSNSFGKLVDEEGGEVKFDYGPSESEK